MSSSPLKDEVFISSVFSDESALFRTPAEPDPGDLVTIRLRVKSQEEDIRASLLVGYPAVILPMEKKRSDSAFDWYEARLQCCGDASVFYTFLISWRGKYVHYRKNGAVLTE